MKVDVLISEDMMVNSEDSYSSRHMSARIGIGDL